MKRFVRLILTLVLCLALSLSSVLAGIPAAHATDIGAGTKLPLNIYRISSLTADAKSVIQLEVGSSTMLVDGRPVILEAAPVILNSRTLLPIRAVVETMGGTIAWDASTRKVTIQRNDKTVELWIGWSSANLNGRSTTIDSDARVVPIIMNGRTLLPLRFVAESLGMDVEWNATTQVITLTYSVNEIVTPPVSYTLAVTTMGNGIVTPATGTTHVYGTVVTLTATPAAGYTFIGWSGGLTGATNPITITMDAAKSVTATFAVTPPVVTVDWCEVGREYVAPGGLTVTVNSIVRVEQPGSVQYTVSYRLKNNTMDKKLDEGSFKLFLKEGGGKNQYGFFNALFPQGSIDRSYTFEILKSETPSCLEFNDQDSAFFRGTPAKDTLKWQVNP